MGTSTLEEPIPSLAEAQAARAFWDAHRDELVRRYAGQFVAAQNEEVIASDPDLASLVGRLTSRGLNTRTDVAIEFIAPNQYSLLL